jgi:hypothetical protein
MRHLDSDSQNEIIKFIDEHRTAPTCYYNDITVENFYCLQTKLEKSIKFLEKLMNYNQYTLTNKF